MIGFGFLLVICAAISLLFSAATSKETTETECEHGAPTGENTKEIRVLNLLDYMQLVSAHGLSLVFAQVPPHHVRMSQKTQFVSTT